MQTRAGRCKMQSRNQTTQHLCTSTMFNRASTNKTFKLIKTFITLNYCIINNKIRIISNNQQASIKTLSNLRRHKYKEKWWDNNRKVIINVLMLILTWCSIIMDSRTVSGSTWTSIKDIDVLIHKMKLLCPIDWIFCNKSIQEKLQSQLMDTWGRLPTHDQDHDRNQILRHDQIPTRRSRLDTSTLLAHFKVWVLKQMKGQIIRVIMHQIDKGQGKATDRIRGLKKNWITKRINSLKEIPNMIMYNQNFTMLQSLMISNKRSRRASHQWRVKLKKWLHKRKVLSSNDTVSSQTLIKMQKIIKQTICLRRKD